jgi:hypothetical protein
MLSTALVVAAIVEPAGGIDRAEYERRVRLAWSAIEIMLSSIVNFDDPAMMVH